MAYQRTVLESLSVGTSDTDFHYYTIMQLLKELLLRYVIRLYDSVYLYVTLQIYWFGNQQILDFTVHIVGNIKSPACVFVQEYLQNGQEAGLWAPAIPNNAFLATLISLVGGRLYREHTIDTSQVVLAFHDYLGCNSRSDTTHITGSRLRLVNVVRASLLEFFDNVDKLHIPSVNYQDCVRAWTAKREFQRRIEGAIDLSLYRDIHVL